MEPNFLQYLGDAATPNKHLPAVPNWRSISFKVDQGLRSTGFSLYSLYFVFPRKIDFNNCKIKREKKDRENTHNLIIQIS